MNGIETADTSLSEAFPRLWRFPGLFLNVCKGKKVSIEEAAIALVDGYAEPVSAGETFVLLLEGGEFDTADGLLERGDFLAALEGTTPAKLRHKLNEERKAFRQRRLMRFNELRESARRLGVRDEYEERIARLENAELTEYSEVDEQLAQLGTELEGIERERGEALRRRFEMRCPIDERQAWPPACFAIERALESKELDRGAWLLDQKARSSSVAAGTAFFEEPPQWPYSESPRTVCAWFFERAAARQGFFERWGPPDDDLAAWSLLRSLTQVLHQEGELNADWLGRFAATLDSFLSHGLPPEGRPAQARDGFIWTYLVETSSPWMPALSQRHDGRQPLVVPDPAVASPSLDAITDLVLVFDPLNMLPPPAEGELRLTPATLFRLMKDPATRRQAFAREIGLQIPLLQALPRPLPTLKSWVVGVEDLDRIAARLLAEPEAGANVRLEFQEVSEFIRVLLETLGLRYQRFEDLDLLAFLANGNPALLQELLRALLSVIAGSGGRHRRAISRSIIDEAWQSENLRRRAREILIGPLADRSDLRLVLGVLYYNSITGPIDSSSTASELARDVQAYSDGIAVMDCLEALEELGLIEATAGLEEGEERRFLLRRGGIGMLLEDFLPNELDAYLAI